MGQLKNLSSNALGQRQIFQMDTQALVAAIADTHDVRLKGVLDALQIGILIEDEQRFVKLVNRAFLSMFQIPLSAEEFAVIDCETSAQAAKKAFLDEEGFTASIAQRLHERRSHLGEILELKDGRFLERQYYPLYVDEEYRGHAWVYFDVSEKMLLQRELRKAAATDELTELPNRRELLSNLNRQIEIARRYERPLSVLICDVDHFKQINDRYGHPCGDAVLRALSTRMLREKRAADTLGRWGGEEFLMVLPETDLFAAQQFAERLRSQIANDQQPNIPQPVTVSIGVHECGREDGAESSVAAADEWLYVAKRNGRNRVCSKLSPNVPCALEYSV